MPRQNPQITNDLDHCAAACKGAMRWAYLRNPKHPHNTWLVLRTAGRLAYYWPTCPDLYTSTQPQQCHPETCQLLLLIIAASRSRRLGRRAPITAGVAHTRQCRCAHIVIQNGSVNSETLLLHCWTEQCWHSPLQQSAALCCLLLPCCTHGVLGGQASALPAGVPGSPSRGGCDGRCGAVGGCCRRRCDLCMLQLCQQVLQPCHHNIKAWALLRHGRPAILRAPATHQGA